MDISVPGEPLTLREVIRVPAQLYEAALQRLYGGTQYNRKSYQRRNIDSPLLPKVPHLRQCGILQKTSKPISLVRPVYALQDLSLLARKVNSFSWYTDVVGFYVCSWLSLCRLASDGFGRRSLGDEHLQNAGSEQKVSSCL